MAHSFLHCYLMTHDGGFAPNPYYRVLTLATCKPRIRHYAQVGDWISGWTAKTVRDKHNQPHRFNSQQLIYLAKISKIIPIEEYREAYPEKRSKLIGTKSSSTRSGCGGKRIVTNHSQRYNDGDNIYEPIWGNGTVIDFKQHKHQHGHENLMEHDLKGKNVLICDEFYYFGWENSVEKDESLFNYTVPRWKKIKLEDVEAFIQGITDSYTPGLHIHRDEDNS